MLYSGVKLVSSHALDIIDTRPKALRGPRRLTLGKRIRLTLGCGECVSVVGEEFMGQDCLNSSLGLSGNPSF